MHTNIHTNESDQVVRLSRGIILFFVFCEPAKPRDGEREKEK